ncbi:MAG: hypothetical protein F4X94_07430 [Dehalococcoidia bacterium]|nr:hypothetical protein [Dehalococcoidia bacterium]
MIKNLTSLIPRTWRVRRETEVAKRTEIETRLESLEMSVDFLRKRGLPPDAAFDIALQLSGVPNTESVLNRLSPGDWQRMLPALDNSEALGPAVHATRFASTEPIRDLLSRIILGELEKPGDAPRSVTELVSRIGKNDLESFLKLRHVLWKERDLSWTIIRSNIYCLKGPLDYPGLLDSDELSRLAELDLIEFAPVPFESKFPGEIAQKLLSFGDRRISVVSSKPDTTLYLGHYALTGDGRYIIDLYDGPFKMTYGHFEDVCGEWRKQGFEVRDMVVLS